MTTLTLELSDEQMRLLREQADLARLAPEELVLQGVEEWLHNRSESFDRAVEHVLTKNADLYQRLA